MDFHNEIVSWVGQISEASGLPLTGNADRSVHEGLEIELALRPIDFVELSGNLSINNDHLIDHTEYVADWASDSYPPQVVEIDRSGNRIAGFPSMLANVRADATYLGFTAGIAWRYVGRQYLDNSESIAASIRSYHITHASLMYRLEDMFGLSALQIKLQVNNVFDRLYEAGGYVDDVTANAVDNTIAVTPYYIPAATRNWFLSVRWHL